MAIWNLFESYLVCLGLPRMVTIAVLRLSRTHTQTDADDSADLLSFGCSV